VSNLEAELTYSPSRETLKKLFEDIFRTVVARVCQKHKLLVNFQELEQFIKTSETKPLLAEDTVELEVVLGRDEKLRRS